MSSKSVSKISVRLLPWRSLEKKGIDISSVILARMRCSLHRLSHSYASVDHDKIDSQNTLLQIMIY
jgi:hypothetical protein